MSWPSVGALLLGGVRIPGVGGVALLCCRGLGCPLPGRFALLRRRALGLSSGRVARLFCGGRGEVLLGRIARLGGGSGLLLGRVARLGGGSGLLLGRVAPLGGGGGAP